MTAGPTPAAASGAPYRPRVTRAARPATVDVEAIDESGVVRTTPIAGEHPLTIFVD